MDESNADTEHADKEQSVGNEWGKLFVVGGFEKEVDGEEEEEC